MSKNNNKTLVSIISVVLVVLGVAAVLGFFMNFSNGFNESVKTFYLVHKGENITALDSKMTLEKGLTYEFECKYLVAPKDDSFTVKIVPNDDTTVNFDFTVDGKDYTFDEIKDFSSYFALKESENGFSFSVPLVYSMQGVLESIYSENEVVINGELNSNNNYFTVQVANYDNSVVYNIDFNILEVVVGDDESENGSSSTETVQVRYLLDGFVLESKEYNVGSKIKAPTLDSSLSQLYMIDNWTYNGTIVDFNTFTVEKDTDLVAVFVKPVLVNLYVGDSYERIILRPGSSYELPQLESNSLFKFEGWKTSGISSPIITDYTIENITSNKYYYAQYTLDYENAEAGMYDNRYQLVKSWSELLSDKTVEIANGELFTQPYCYSDDIDSIQNALSGTIILPNDDSISRFSVHAFNGNADLKTLVVRSTFDSSGLGLSLTSSTSFSELIILDYVEYISGIFTNVSDVNIYYTEVGSIGRLEGVKGIYEYSETQPTTDGNYWRFVNGKPTPW